MYHILAGFFTTICVYAVLDKSNNFNKSTKLCSLILLFMLTLLSYTIFKVN